MVVARSIIVKWVRESQGEMDARFGRCIPAASITPQASTSATAPLRNFLSSCPSYPKFCEHLLQCLGVGRFQHVPDWKKPDVQSYENSYSTVRQQQAPQWRAGDTNDTHRSRLHGRKVPLLLHFDVNKTVIQSDSVQMKGRVGVLSIRGTHGSRKPHFGLRV